MSKQVYISADYDDRSGDREVVNDLKRWGQDNKHKTDFIDMSEARSGSVSKNSDCRICELKNEFNRQINASSAVIFVIGDNTALRTAGNTCQRAYKPQWSCYCTSYKGNALGSKLCNVYSLTQFGNNDDVSPINSCSYLRHEFEQAKKKGKKIIIIYNSYYKQPSWLPSYMSGYENIAVAFWTRNINGNRIGNYTVIKQALGYE